MMKYVQGRDLIDDNITSMARNMKRAETELQLRVRSAGSTTQAPTARPQSCWESAPTILLRDPWWIGGKPEANVRADVESVLEL